MFTAPQGGNKGNDQIGSKNKVIFGQVFLNRRIRGGSSQCCRRSCCNKDRRQWSVYEQRIKK